MGVGTEDIEATDSLFVSQPQIVANFQDLGYSGSGGYKATAAITATAAGTTTLTVTSLRKQIFTGTTTQTIVMPVTSTLAVGFAFEITNNSTGVLTIQSSETNEICKIQPTERGILTCISISVATAAGWTYSIIKSTATTTPLSQQVSIQSAPTGAVEGGVTDFLASGLTLVNSVVLGNATTSATSDASGSLIDLNPDGTWELASDAYDAANQTFSITAGNEYFLYCGITSASVGKIQNKVTLWYSDESSDTAGTATAGNEAYGIITASYTLLANFKLTESTAGLATRTYQKLINMTALGIHSTGSNPYTEAQMLDLVRGGYFEGMANTKNIAVKSVGKNLFDKSKVEFNKVLNSTSGGIATSVGNAISEFIGIKAGINYRLSNNVNSATFGHCFYDANKTYISGFASATSSAVTLSTPSDAKFVRISLVLTDIDILSLVEGIITLATYESFRYSQYETECELAGLLFGNGARDTLDAEGNHIQRIKEVAVTHPATVNIATYTDASTTSDCVLVQDDGTIVYGVVDGSISTTGDGDLQYQLTTPITTNLITEGKASGIVKSFASGTIYQDCAYNESVVADADPKLTVSALREITQVTYVDETTDEVIEVPVSGLTLSTDGTEITGTGITNAETYRVKGYLSYNISALLTGNVTVNQSAVIASLNAIVDKQSAQITSLTDITNLLIALV